MIVGINQDVLNFFNEKNDFLAPIFNKEKYLDEITLAFLFSYLILYAILLVFLLSRFSRKKEILSLIKKNQDSSKSKITYSKSDLEFDNFQKVNDQKDQESITDNNLDNQKKKSFNPTSNYFNSLRQGYDLDRNFDEDTSDN